MITANFFVTVFLAYYSMYVIELIVNKNTRKNTVNKNIKLEELRTKAIKTLEEQKEFISLKYPKRKGKFKFTFKWLFIFITKIILFLILLKIFSWVLKANNIDLALWQAVLFIIIFPILFNLLLSRLKLQTNDLSVFFRGWIK